MRRLWLGALALACVSALTACSEPAPRTAGEVASRSPDETDSPAKPDEAGGQDDKEAGGQDDKPDAPVEDPAPGFEVTTFSGDEFALGEQRGTPVVLNFWESW
jgi:hypothetical protein